MCGIVGIIEPGRSLWPAEPFEFDHMRHRGPDDCGVWTGQDVALGHVRLSIIDLTAAGHQPFEKDGDHVLVYNGELYNYIELRSQLQDAGIVFRTQSDTEVIYEAYRHWGIDCLSRFRGMFAFAIWSRSQRTLFAARDRTGEKPFFYTVSDQTLFFASELRMLLSLLPEEQGLNQEAVLQFLVHQFVPDPGCLIDGVKKLPPGHYLTFSPGSTPKVESYWVWEEAGSSTAEQTAKSVEEQIAFALDEAAKLTLRSDVPVGFSLSGGLDSSALALLAAKNSDAPIHAFSVGYPGEPENDERRYASQLAKELGMPFHPIVLHENEFVREFPQLVAAMDEPIGDIAAYGYYSIAREARKQGIKVLISGIGGDEVFWGYDWVREAASLSLEKADLLKNGVGFPTELRARLGGMKWVRQLARNHSTPLPIKRWAARCAQFSRMRLADPVSLVFDEMVDGVELSLRLLKPLVDGALNESFSKEHFRLKGRVDLLSMEAIPKEVNGLLARGWLASNCLALCDKMSMASSVELRLPLLESGLLDNVLGSPETVDDWASDSKARFKKTLAGIVSPEILNRRKRGFAPPVSQWMRSVILANKEKILSGYLIEAGWLKRSTVEKQLSRLNTSNKPLQLFYRLLLLEMWATQYHLRKRYL